MDIDNYVAVSGLPGLYEMVSNKPGGLVIKDLDSGKIKFASVRQHNFNPIASIGIYVTTDEDTLNLKEVFTKMLAAIDKTPLPDKKAANKDLMTYITTVMPDADADRVYPSDVKKLIKWFSFLNERNLLSLEEEKEEVEATAEEKAEAPAKEEKKAAKKTVKAEKKPAKAKKATKKKEKK